MAAAVRRKIMTLDDRVDVLKRIDNGEFCCSIAAAVNCSEGMGEWRQIRQAATATQKKMNDFFVNH